ncbi:MAG: helix-turn-helix transcriptional regulator [bacterium]|nr:helix-turn-helix transcriptional regulator [bacterium]
MKHWTEDAGAFRHWVVDEFVDVIKARLKEKNISQETFADMANCSKLAVLEILNKEEYQLLGISDMIKWARALGLKLSIVVYDDDDPDNKLGPVFAEAFVDLWDKCLRPRNFKALKEWRENNYKEGGE